MNIIMSYIDYHIATIEQREVFSFTKEQTDEIYKKIHDSEHVKGVVMISTCNRTEVYLSVEEGYHEIPFRLLCKAMGVDFNKYEIMNRTIEGNDVLVHLCQLSAGCKSQIWGEDQIISQVRDSIKQARTGKYSDTILNVVFRTGVSAGKKVKTLVDFKIRDNSTASKAVSIIKENKSINKVLVIGNGMIGRLVVELLVKAGKDVTMTLRKYKYSENVVPHGAETIHYDKRYEKIRNYDAVISATLSPHFTVEREKLEEAGQLELIPKVFIDLAVPRDIDPNVASLENVDYFNVDDISRENIIANKEKQMEEINEIIAKYIDDFYKWYDYKMKLEG